MLKRHITYEDYDGVTKEMDAEFHISKSEGAILSAKKINGMSYAEALQKMVNDQDMESMLKVFREMVIMAYGVRSEDGKRFVKDVGEGVNGIQFSAGRAFSQTPAFDELFMDILQEENGLVNFFNGVLPTYSPSNRALNVSPSVNS